MKDVAGCPVIMGSDQQNEFFLLAGGSRVSSVYQAAEQAPQNPYVVATLAQGLPSCIEIDKRTPRDV